MPPPRGKFNPIEGPGDFDVTKTVHNDTYPAIDSANADLSGRAVFVVGGTKGIGKEVSLSFARAGASQIAVAARSVGDALKDEIASAAKAAGKREPEFLPLSVDVTNREAVDGAAAQIEKAFGRLDILANVAGIVGGFASIADSDPDSWWNVFDVNLRGPYLTCRALLPLLLKSEGGLKNICLVSSVGAWLANPGLNAYQPSKLALVRLAHFIAAEYGQQGVTCFSLHPGNVVTEILGPNGPPKELEFIFTETPRLAADTILYLIKDKKDWLNGRYINCTWDMPELEAQKDAIVREDKLKVTLRI